MKNESCTVNGVATLGKKSNSLGSSGSISPIGAKPPAPASVVSISPDTHFICGLVTQTPESISIPVVLSVI